MPVGSSPRRPRRSSRSRPSDVLHPVLARRTIRPFVTSTSTRDAGPAPVLKNRRRSAPSTSTTSPNRHDRTDRLDPARPGHALEGVDLRAALGVRRPGGTTTRNEHQRVAAGQLLLLGDRRQPPHEPHLVDRVLCPELGGLPTTGLALVQPLHVTSCAEPRRRHRQRDTVQPRSCGRCPHQGACGRLVVPSIGGLRRSNHTGDAPKTQRGDPISGRLSANVCPAASYSPTTSRLQYHRRWQA